MNPGSLKELRGRVSSWPAFFLEFARVAGPYWRSEEKWKIRGLTAFLVVLTVAQVVFPIALNLWNESFFNALENRSMGRFLFLIGVLVAIIGGDMSITALHLRVKRRLQVD